MQFDINQFATKIDSFKNILYKKMSEHDFYTSKLKEASDKKLEYENNVELYKQSYAFLSNINQELRTKLVSEIEKLVTIAISKILNDDTLEFKLEFETTATAVNTKCRLYDKYTQESYDIIDSFGGGLSDIISTVLRLISIELWQPKNTLPVLLDETGKFVSSEFQAQFGEFLKSWSSEFSRQIILITHSESAAMNADKIIKISKRNNKSEVS